MAKTTILKYQGDKDGVGHPLGVKHFIAKLTNGAIINQYGIRIGSYKRIVTDGGSTKDVQEIEITLEVDD